MENRVMRCTIEFSVQYICPILYARHTYVVCAMGLICTARERMRSCWVEICFLIEGV